MNAMTCADVQEQLDLFAAGECDEPMRAALEQHLRLPSCAARYAASQRMLGLLDLHWSEPALNRLQQRIEQQRRPARKQRFARPFLRGFVAAAALILIAVGLIWWLPQRDNEPQFALLVHTNRQSLRLDSQFPSRTVDSTPALQKDKGAEAVPMVARAVGTGAELRRDLLKAQHDGKLPPPAVALDLTLVNRGKRAIEVRIGEETPTLTLNVLGEGVLRLPATGAETPAFLQPQSLRLEPGESHVLRINRLVAGSHGKLEYIYLTEPGEYTLSAELRFTADGQPMTVTGEPVRIVVEGNR